MNISSTSLFDPKYLGPLRRRFQTLGLNRRHAATLSAYVQKQYKHRGEGLIPLLKRLSESLLGFLTGREGKTPWVRYRHRFPLPLYFLRKYSRRVLFRLTKLHTIITLNEVTKAQAAKFMDAVRAPRPSEDDLRGARNLIDHGVHALPYPNEIRVTGKMQSFPLALVPLQVQAKQCDMRNLSLKRRRAASIERSADLIVRSLDYLHSPMWKDLLMLEPTIQAFYPLEYDYFVAPCALSDTISDKIPSGVGRAVDLAKQGKHRLEPVFVGNLGFSQEPGGKLRVFASPHLVWQAILEPLKLFLMGILRSLLQDCTHNQSAGAEWVQGELLSGKTVHSLDLTEATNLFPLDLQIPILTELGVSASQIRIFERVARGNWKVPSAIQRHGYPPEVSWNRGQPLGLAPSFGLFALTHHCLVQGICLELGVDTDCYRILGDDIVISDSAVARVYVVTMEKMGCKIAHEKSIVSKDSAEFAGYRITHQEIVRAGKMRKLTTSNVLEIAKMYESTLEQEVHPELSKTLGEMLSVPKSMGGAGLDIADPSRVIDKIDEIREQERRNAFGDILEQRCARVMLATGLITRIAPCLKRGTRFTQYVEIIDYGLEKGHLTRIAIKQYGLSWAVSTVEQCVKAQLCDPAREFPVDNEIRRRFNVPLGADLPTAKKRVNLYFQRYYHCLSNLNNHNVLLRWMERGILQGKERSLRSLLKE